MATAAGGGWGGSSLTHLHGTPGPTQDLLPGKQNGGNTRVHAEWGVAGIFTPSGPPPKENSPPLLFDDSIGVPRTYLRTHSLWRIVCTHNSGCGLAILRLQPKSWATLSRRSGLYREVVFKTGQNRDPTL